MGLKLFAHRIYGQGEITMPTRGFFPFLSVTNAKEAVAFYSRVFETEPAHLLDMPDGQIMHCEFRFGGARFFLSEELPEHGGTPSPASLGATTVAIHLYVDDCDAMVPGARSLRSRMGGHNSFARHDAVRNPSRSRQAVQEHGGLTESPVEECMAELADRAFPMGALGRAVTYPTTTPAPYPSQPLTVRLKYVPGTQRPLKNLRDP